MTHYLRYAHCEGHTDVCYSDDSKYFITCGGEGDFRVYNDYNDNDQKDVSVGDRAWAVFQKGDSLYVATDTNIVQAYTFPKLQVNGLISRFRAPVTQIDVSCDGKKLAAGSCDMEIHVVDLETLESKTYSGHTAPIYSVSLDPCLKYLASASCDGTVKVWNMQTGDSEKSFNCVLKSNSFETAKHVVRIHFQPKEGTLLAVPSGKSIQLYERNYWTVAQSLSVVDGKHDFSVAKFSACGKYLAGGDASGKIYVWEVKSEKLMAKYESQFEFSISAIAWHKDSQSLVFCNTDGRLGELKVKTDQDLWDSVDSENITAGDIAPEDIPLGVPDFEDDDEDNENAISIEKIKAESGFGEEGSSQGSEKGDKDEKESIPDLYSRQEPQVPITELQETFQPSSTPSHLQQRFMVWNDVGIVRHFNTEEIEDIDIEFHDTTHHHNFRMKNSNGYTMATLTKQALLLASPRIGQESSQVMCVLLKAWDSQKDWFWSLGSEEAIGLAGGHNWLAVATDRLMLRIFSLDGTQTDVISIPGPLISMVGHQQEMTIFFYSAQGFEGDHFISCLHLRIDPMTKLASQKSLQPIPLTPKSSLRWIGFTDEGSPSYLDTEGVIRVSYKSTWRPIAALEDRPKGKFDHYFIVGIGEIDHTIRCILCKGAYYPPVIPKPLMSVINWQIPLCEMDSGKSELEEDLLRSVITLPNLNDYESEEFPDARKNIEKKISVTIMKLFALACRSELDGRALSLCESMPTVEVVKLASKYATTLGRHQLANKVSQLALKMMQRMEEREMEEEQQAASSRSSHVNGSQDIFCDSEPNSTNRKENVNPNGTTKKLDVAPKPFLIKRQRSQTASAPATMDDGSQDIFCDEVESESTSVATNNKENPILAMKKKKSEMAAKLFNVKPPNPFKVPSGKTETEPTQKVSSVIDWFCQNRSKLAEEHPHLSEKDLAIVSMKKYKQEMSDKKSPVDELNPMDKLTTKEKSVMKEKLSKFLSQDTIDLLMTTDEESVRVAPEEEKKKRKNTDNQGEKAPKKKATSKLQAFSFSKKASS